MRIPFADWRPDVADLDSEFATVARNVLPASRSYRPLQSFAPLTQALPAACHGAATFKRADGVVVNLAGTQTGLFKLNAGAWSNISRAAGGPYTAGAEDFWQFKQFGGLALATNFRDVPQKFDIESGALFSVLGGSPPLAKYIAVVGDQVVLGHLDLDRASSIHWSGTNNAEQWTAGVNNSDVQAFPDGGHVMGITGGTVGYVFQQSAIRRMLPKPGSMELYQFDVIEPDRGLVAPRSLVQIGRRIFYLSQDGFWMFTGEGSQPIGVERVDRTFYSRLDTSRIDKVIGAADPVNQIVVWIYPSRSSPNGQPDQALIYHWSIDKWTEAAISGELIIPLATESITLDSMPSYGYTNLDTLPFSLDASFWRGGSVLLALFGSDHKAQVASGLSLAATIETGEFNLAKTGRTLITAAAPLVESTAAQIAVSNRERLGDAAEWGVPAGVEVTGDCSLMESGRYQRLRMTIEAGVPWDHANGIELTAAPDGSR
jgi:hypothetical protein